MELIATEPLCAVVELRQYTLHPGQRDVLIALFEREFVEPLESAGMTVMGQFYDLDRPDRFVWLRGFPDMYRRAQGLSAFYGGPVWQVHRDAANATMVDSDNVLLLRPARAGAGIALAERQRAPLGARTRPPLRVVATLNRFARPADLQRVTHFETVLVPMLERAGARLLGHYITESSRNSYPRLPVREGEHLFVWFLAFDSDNAYTRFVEWLDASVTWREQIAIWNRGLVGAPETLRLAPTPRSLIHA